MPAEFEPFMDDQIKECVHYGALQKKEEVKKTSDPDFPIVVSALGIEPHYI